LLEIALLSTLFVLPAFAWMPNELLPEKTECWATALLPVAPVRPFRLLIEDDIVGRCRGDGDAIGSGDQNRPKRRGAIDGDRLGDGQGAKAARIEAIDLATRSGFGNRAGESPAGGRAAARIGVGADAGDPGPLGVGRRRRQKPDS